MTTKPDRWDKLASTLPMRQLRSVYLEDVAKLLRNEHRAVVRMVLQQRNDCQANANATCAQTQDMWVARAAQCQDILDHLNERAK